MSYQVLHEDEHLFQLKHPDGSSFTVAKAGLSPAVLKKIAGMKPVKMADGGVVPDEPGPNATPKADSVDAIVNDASRAAPAQQDPNAAPDMTKFFKNGTLDMDAYLASNPQAPLSSQVTAAGNLAQRQDAQSYFQNKAATDQAQALQTQKEQIDAYNQHAAKVGLPQKPYSPEVQAMMAQQSAPSPTAGAPQAPAMPQAGAPQQGGAPSDMAGIPGMGMIGDAYNQIAKGTMGMANAKAQEAKEQTGALDNYIKQSQDAAAKYNAQRTTLEQEHETLMKSVADAKIDPHKFWDDKSTGGKISAGIGLILSGIGSGMSGQPNMAMAVLNKQMDASMEAQKANLGKNESLLRMNMERLRDSHAAEAATRLQMNAVLQGQLQRAAAASGSKQAMANAQVAIGQLKMQAVPLMQQMAMWGVKAQSLGAGTGEGGLPVGHEPVGLLGDKEYSGKRVVANGRAYQANSDEEARQMRTQGAAADEVQSLVKQLDTLGPSATITGSEAWNRAQAIRAKLGTAIPQLGGLNRLNETEIHQALDMVKDPTSFKQLMNGSARNHQFFRNVHEALEAQRKNSLIGYRGMESIPSRKQGWGN